MFFVFPNTCMTTTYKRTKIPCFSGLNTTCLSDMQVVFSTVNITSTPQRLAPRIRSQWSRPTSKTAALVNRYLLIKLITPFARHFYSP